MGLDAILVILALLFILYSLYTELVGASFTFVIAIGFLGVFQVLTPSEILSGFANEQIAVIIMLLLVGDIYRQTSILDIFFDKIFRKAKTYRAFRRRMMVIVAFFSAFLNNTPLVALMIPYVHTWSSRNNRSVSKLLMPLSFAAILGGCATLIGTSTNLIVNGLVEDQTIISDLQPLQIFDFVWVGVPMIFIGILYIGTIGQWLLPDNKSDEDDLLQHARHYVVEVEVKPDCKLIGQTIRETEFFGNENMQVVEIIRSDKRNIPATPNIIIFEGDLLVFAGDTHNIADMVNANPKLVIPSVGMFGRKSQLEVIEIVVSHNSTLIGKKLGRENFRQKYDATVLAIHRNGETFAGKIENIQLKAGDALLLLTGCEFAPLARKTTDFYIISTVKEIRRLGTMKTLTLVLGTLLVIVFAALGIIRLFMGILILLSVSLLMRIANPKELRKSVDLDLGLIIALSLALGTAMIKTGVAEFIANTFIKWFIPLGDLGLLGGIYFITAIMAAFITNKAAVAIIFPISLTMAQHLQMPPTPFVLVVSFAAAANFMTPIGYQTNLMVYGPGGYKFKDFLRVGTPLTLIYMVVAVLIMHQMYF